MSAAPNAEDRFTGRVDSYQLSRPGYPKSILNLLRLECGLTPRSKIVDIAAGTGIFSAIFLENGNPVTAIEPNGEMRSACAGLQARYAQLTVLEGSAENTGLAEACANFVTVAQALHWFDLDRARREFARILKPRGWCVIAYNERRRAGDPFHDGYEGLLERFGIDYEAVLRRHANENELRAFFAPSSLERRSFRNSQTLGREALVARIVSSSYMPTAGHAAYPAMLESIERLFAENQKDGVVEIDYDCTVSFGQFI